MSPYVHMGERESDVADYTGKVQFFRAFKCPPEHEAEGDRFFTHHAEWMERTHPGEGDKALLQYTVSKDTDDEGNIIFLLYEVYETVAGAENHGKLAHDDGEILNEYVAFGEKCETLGGGRGEVRHSLW